MNSNIKSPQKAPTEQLIVQKTDDGYRVCSPLNPATQYVVQDDGENITCTCPQFEEYAHVPNWRCKHIAAVLKSLDTQDPESDDGAAGAAQPNGTPPPKEPPTQRKSGGRNGEASMLIKRSLSPDGRIDSLSVEFSVPVGKISTEGIKEQAAKAIKLQGEIMQGFAKGNGNGNGNSHRANGNGNVRGAVAAQLLNIDAMDTKRGRSLFINVFVEKQIAKLFGDEEKLGEALTAAGYAEQAESIEEGMELNLPCRAVTKRNGKYLNIERLLPAENGD